MVLYGGADLAEQAILNSANERGLRVMCSARMDADLRAFRLGAGAILYSGCLPQDCHYITGQVAGAKRASDLKMFERMGMSPGRFHRMDLSC